MTAFCRYGFGLSAKRFTYCAGNRTFLTVTALFDSLSAGTDAPGASYTYSYRANHVCDGLRGAADPLR